MNIEHRKILKGALATVVVALLFPPYQFQAANGAVFGAGWAFILTGAKYNGYPATVNVALLAAEWIAIGIVSAILWKLSVAGQGITATQQLTSKVDGSPGARSAIRTALDKMKQ